MNITTFNVNSVRARLERVLAWLDRHAPDVLCLQETKCTDADFPFEAFRARGYEVAHHGQKSYNGVAIVSRLPLADVVRGIPDAEDPQARGISARVGGLRVVNLYVPNGGELTSDKYPYKLAWLERLTDVLRPLAQEGGLVMCGDYNIAPADADCHDPERWRGQVLVSEPERERFRALLAVGLVDAFRLFDTRASQFTWWDYRGDMFAQGKGLRIDHHLITADVRARALDVTVDRLERAGGNGQQPSDHAPVTLHLRD
jgi:exodeoxyribonuclease-3